jgi:hypothetical protein
MQIAVAVPEAGEAGACFLLHQRSVVALEAQGVTPRLEGRIDQRRILLQQQPEVVVGVRLVAADAVAVTDRAVVIGVLHQQRRHVAEHAAIRRLDLLVVAVEAERRACLLGGGQPHVAGEAEIRAEMPELELVVRRVRVVAAGTAIGHRQVLAAGRDPRRGAFLVALDAHRVGGHVQPEGVFPDVRVRVAVEALVTARGLVHELTAHEVGVAGFGGAEVGSFRGPVLVGSGRCPEDRGEWSHKHAAAHDTEPRAAAEMASGFALTAAHRMWTGKRRAPASARCSLYMSEGPDLSLRGAANGKSGPFSHWRTRPGSVTYIWCGGRPEQEAMT